MQHMKLGWVVGGGGWGRHWLLFTRFTHMRIRVNQHNVPPPPCVLIVNQRGLGGGGDGEVESVSGGGGSDGGWE